MKRTLFNDGWAIQPKSNLFGAFMGQAAEPEPVTLPHDAMISRQRSKDCVGYEGFFPTGSFEYLKTFTFGEEYRNKTVSLEFEGVYMKAEVFVNGEYAGHYPYGYGEFSVCLDNFIKYGEENSIRVTCDTAHDHRWYSGQGIYRNVNLVESGLEHFAQNGIRVSTEAVNSEDGTATIVIESSLENMRHTPKTVKVMSLICDAAGKEVYRAETPATMFPGKTVVRQKIVLKDAKLWDTETPNLYTVKSSLNAADELDADCNSFGIRSLQLDAVHGFRLNGKTVNLKGGCIHHDNGVIGAATFEAAEERRARILKDAGFNALRSAHHPMSRAMLDACDRIGLLVMDEVADMWTISKNADDFSQYFPDYWESVCEGMVAKDYNHPCVVLYSIGNEIPDVGKPNGRNWGRKLADKIRSLDATRFTMNSVNALLAAQDVLIKFVKQMAQAPKAVPSAEPEGRGSPPEGSDVNSTMSSMDGVMAMIFQIPEVAQSLEEAYACVDVAGYNYAESQYEGDGKKYPDRVILGSEDFPKDIALNWALTERLPFVIGDFTWTAWEYLGESGIAKISYGTPAGASLGSMADYPYLVSSTGDIDITGFRRPVSYWREVVWGKRKAPYIAVLKPEHYGEKPNAGNWSWSDSESSWTWPGFEGKPVQLEVYSNADEVALLLNGKELARKAISRDGEKDKSDAFKAVFDTVYTPGKLEAVAFSGGSETGRYALETAEKVAQIKADSEKGSAASGQGTLFFINLALCDSEGRVNTAASEKIKLSLDGPGVLQGFGSGAPATEESFCSDEQTPFYGRAFAVVRATGDGKITVKAEAEGLPVTEVVLA